MYRKTTSLIAAAAVAAAMTTAAAAQTKPLRHHQNRQAVAARYNDERPPLTVSKRSWLDPGPVVPVGSMSNYVTASTVFNRTPDQVNQRSLYGNELLPRPLEIPVRSQPLIEFETPAYPY
ncbi:hypothetical protein [Methylocapsa aurea]|uniref:hypothetical protein n=1 Tax=Methylocapsa aurea TaxID=663610 RepID=UPI00056C1203|nr:hypothetical protein [Methylocapsa aurea]